MANDRRSRKRRKAWGTLAIYRFELASADAQMGVVEDVNDNGLFIAMRQPPPEGTLLSLSVYSQAGPEGRSVVKARGIVRWRRLGPESAGAGVQFLQFAEGEQGHDNWLALLATAAPVHPPRLRPGPQVPVIERPWPQVPVIERPGSFQLRPAGWY